MSGDHLACPDWHAVALMQFEHGLELGSAWPKSPAIVNFSSTHFDKGCTLVHDAGLDPTDVVVLLTLRVQGLIVLNSMLGRTQPCRPCKQTAELACTQSPA